MWTPVALMIVISAGLSGSALAGDAVTSKQMDDVLEELRKIRMLLERTSRSPSGTHTARVELDLKGVPVLGSEDAKVAIVEFMDYQCPYCRRFHSQTFPDLKKLFIDTGKVKFYVMDLPLNEHPQALLAAQAGRCAAEQGKFWELYDLMQSDGDSLGKDKIAELGEKSGLGAERFRECLESGRYSEAVRMGIAEAYRKGIEATPTFVVGRSTSSGVDGELVVGAVPLGIFQEKINAATP